jgi:hypothetical protein
VSVPSVEAISFVDPRQALRAWDQAVHRGEDLSEPTNRYLASMDVGMLCWCRCLLRPRAPEFGYRRQRRSRSSLESREKSEARPEGGEAGGQWRARIDAMYVTRGRYGQGGDERAEPIDWVGLQPLDASSKQAVLHTEWAVGRWVGDDRTDVLNPGEKVLRQRQLVLARPQRQSPAAEGGSTWLAIASVNLLQETLIMGTTNHRTAGMFRPSLSAVFVIGLCVIWINGCDPNHGDMTALRTEVQQTRREIGELKSKVAGLNTRVAQLEQPLDPDAAAVMKSLPSSPPMPQPIQADTIKKVIANCVGQVHRLETTPAAEGWKGRIFADFDAYYNQGNRQVVNNNKYVDQSAVYAFNKCMASKGVPLT